MDHVEPAYIDSKRRKEELVSKLDAKDTPTSTTRSMLQNTRTIKIRPVGCVGDHVELIPTYFAMVVALDFSRCTILWSILIHRCEL